MGQGGAAQGHVFVVGLVSIGAALLEIERIAGAGGNQTSVVVRHLMVIPRDDPRREGVHVLQSGVGTVQRVTVAIFFEFEKLAAVVPADLVFARAAFVDVIAQVQDEIEVVLGHGFVGVVVTGFVVLAGGDREAKFFG